MQEKTPADIYFEDLKRQQLGEALENARQIRRTESRCKALTEIARKSSVEDRLPVLLEALKSVRRVKEPIGRVRRGSEVLTLLSRIEGHEERVHEEVRTLIDVAQELDFIGPRSTMLVYILDAISGNGHEATLRSVAEALVKIAETNLPPGRISEEAEWSISNRIEKIREIDKTLYARCLAFLDSSESIGRAIGHLFEGDEFDYEWLEAQARESEES